MLIPADHAQRLVLNDEVHARPYTQVEVPERVAFLALLYRDGGASAASALARLFERMGQPAPQPDVPHLAADLGAFRLKWERHTDFRIHADRMSRFLVLDRGLGRYPAGRVVQRLLEIETYRMMALLAFPVARTVSAEISAAEHALTALTARMAGAGVEDELSTRIARSSDLLRTRVDIEREQQNLEMLAQMNRRAKLQLRLQQTVEGLSVAAITYYAVGLIGYLAKAAVGLGQALTPIS